jgi:spermidine synthase
VDSEQSKLVLQSDAELFFVSLLILFLELTLIRWIGTEIRIFAYLGNLILVVCFFGVGLGCYRSTESVSWVRMSTNFLVLVSLVANPFHLKVLDFNIVTYLLSGFEDAPIWHELSHEWVMGFLAGAIIIGVLVYLLTFVFIPLGQVLGRAMQRSPHLIRAYSINIAGSLVGVWLFNGLSWTSTSPAVWMLAAAVLLTATLLITGIRPLWPASLMIIGAVVVWLGGQSSDLIIWTPYQKLSVRPLMVSTDSHEVQDGYLILVNGTTYQTALNLSDQFFATHPEVVAAEQSNRIHYNIPFSFKPDAHRMLIVGAGTGNNAAAGLRHGVDQIDCVEIDPQIYALGKRIHPEQPYSSSHVTMIVNDARAYFKQAPPGTYDLIWFGWLDAHTLGSSFNNMRLDHYVYTVESFREARRLLAPNGVLVVNFAAPRTWVADRLFNLVRQAFGHDPYVYSEKLIFENGWVPTVTLVVAEHPITAQVIQDPVLRDFATSSEVHLPGTTRATTDDWPYLYLRQARIPKLHWIVSVSILASVLLAGRRTLGVAGGFNWHFFALGAAFLLLEVQTVSRATLLFGMTWIVNAIVISAVLIMILLANLVAWRWPRLPQWFITVGLAVTVVALALVPLDWFNTLTGFTKLVTASAFLTAPVFFAGLIFIRSFAVALDKSQALGSNLIGALIGGLLESVSFMTGIRALVILVGVFYAMALWLRPSLATSKTS